MATMQALLLTLATLGQGNETVLLDFTAPWCGPCQQVAPVVHQLAAAGYPIRQVDIDQNRALAQRFGVSSIPCFVMLVNGKEVARELGVVSSGRLQQMMAMAGNATASGNMNASPRAPAGQATFAGQSPDDPFSQARGASTPGFGRAAQQPAGMTGNAASAGSAGSIDQQLLAATVRIKVQDPDGHSYGTGTIIHQTQGKALILTCAHLFRDSQGRGKLTLDLFGQDNRHGVPVQLLDYDLDRDVALLVMETETPQQVAPVGLASYNAQVGQPIFSVGCSGGDDPTVWTGQVTSIDKYLGPPNIQASGQPKQGRSGGGLFDAEGRLIGICNAADPADNEGLYAALGSIHALLNKHDLTYVAKADGLQNLNSNAIAAAPAATASAMDAMVAAETNNPPSMSADAPGNPFAAGGAAFSFPGVTTGIARDRAETTETEFTDSTEIICLIRSKQNPMAQPRVVVISNATPEVLEWLAEQSIKSQTEPQLTTQKIHQVQRPRLWEPVLRVRTQQQQSRSQFDTNNETTAPERVAQPPSVSPAVQPGRNDIPWRPANVIPNPARIR